MKKWKKKTEPTNKVKVCCSEKNEQRSSVSMGKWAEQPQQKRQQGNTVEEASRILRDHAALSEFKANLVY